MSEQKLYKIRRNLDGLFAASGGGFNKNGKIWKGLGPLRNHFALVVENWESRKDKNRPHPYEDCEVLEIEMVVVNTIPAIEEILGCHERKKTRDRKYNRHLH